MDINAQSNEIVLRQRGRISTAQLRTVLGYALNQATEGAKRVLLVPQVGQGESAAVAQAAQVAIDFMKRRCRVDVMPATAMGEPLSEKQIRKLFGKGLSIERFYPCDHATATLIGELDADGMQRITQGCVTQALSFAVGAKLSKYDAILSISQVQPDAHWGMTGYTQNIAYGLGSEAVHQAVQALPAAQAGNDDSPTRRLMDALQHSFLDKQPILHILAVAQQHGCGLFVGEGDRLFKQACEYSRKSAFTLLKQPVSTMVALLDEQVSSLGEALQALPRLQMVMAQGGQLVLLAPGVRRMGSVEAAISQLPAHFAVSIACTQELAQNSAMQGLGIAAQPLEQAMAYYAPHTLNEGENTLNGTPVYFTSQPMDGWWALSSSFKGLSSQDDKQTQSIAALSATV